MAVLPGWNRTRELGRGFGVSWSDQATGAAAPGSSPAEPARPLPCRMPGAATSRAGPFSPGVQTSGDARTHRNQRHSRPTAGITRRNGARDRHMPARSRRQADCQRSGTAAGAHQPMEGHVKNATTRSCRPDARYPADALLAYFSHGELLGGTAAPVITWQVTGRPAGSWVPFLPRLRPPGLWHGPSGTGCLPLRAASWM